MFRTQHYIWVSCTTLCCLQVSNEIKLERCTPSEHIRLPHACYYFHTKPTGMFIYIGYSRTTAITPHTSRNYFSLHFVKYSKYRKMFQMKAVANESYILCTVQMFHKLQIGFHINGGYNWPVHTNIIFARLPIPNFIAVQLAVSEMEKADRNELCI